MPASTRIWQYAPAKAAYTAFHRSCFPALSTLPAYSPLRLGVRNDHAIPPKIAFKLCATGGRPSRGKKFRHLSTSRYQFNGMRVKVIPSQIQFGRKGCPCKASRVIFASRLPKTWRINSQIRSKPKSVFHQKPAEKDAPKNGRPGLKRKTKRFKILEFR